MYFWRIEALKSKLASAPLTDREVLPYFIAFLAFSTAAALLPAEGMNHWDDLYAAYGMLLSIFGTLYLYRRNGGDRGEHFVQRFLAVGWVVSVRWGALVIPLFLLLVPVLGSPEDTTGALFAYNVITALIPFFLIGHHISDVASRTKSTHV